MTETRTIEECLDLAARHVAGEDIGGEPSDNFIRDFGPKSALAKSYRAQAEAAKAPEKPKAEKAPEPTKPS